MIAIYLSILISFSVFAASKWSVHFEQSIFISCSVITAVLFFFGLAGGLREGFYAILFVSLMCYGGTAWELIRGKKIRTFCTVLLTPSFALFVLSAVTILWIDYGKLLHTVDEFTHWGIAVKVMDYYDSFADVSRELYYASYPPGAALFQYFLQKLNRFFHPGAEFEEWMCFYAFHILEMSAMLSLINGVTWNKKLSVAAALVSVLFMPMVVFDTYYSCILVDPMLGILSAAGWALLLRSDKSFLDDLTLCMILFQLVLMKDSGLLFALILLLAYVVKIWSDESRKTKVLLSAGTVLLPKLLWEAHLYFSGTNLMFRDKVSLLYILEQYWNQSDLMVLQRFNELTEQAVHTPIQLFGRFLKAFYSERLAIIKGYVQVPYFIICFAAISGLIFAWYIMKSQEKIRDYKRKIDWMFSIALTQFIVYAIGLGCVFAFRFADEDAYIVASFQRYMGSQILSMILITCSVMIHELSVGSPVGKILAVTMGVVFLIFIPTGRVKRTLLRTDDAVAVSMRMNEKHRAEEIKKYLPENGHWKILNLDDSGGFSTSCRFFNVDIFPNQTHYLENAILSDLVGKEELRITQEELAECISELDFDYVVVRSDRMIMKDYFALLFEEPKQIPQDALYSIHREEETLLHLVMTIE